MKNKKQIKIVLNSPVVLTYSAICIVALVLHYLTHQLSTTLVFSVYRSSLLDPLTYLRFFTHVCGHASWDHLVSNMLLILLLGPILEDRYGSRAILFLILITALVTGIVSVIFFPRVMLLGASGVVFAMILLAASLNLRSHEIPLTLILVVILYLGREILNGIFVEDNVAQFAHIVGGIVGAVLGYLWRKK